MNAPRESLLVGARDGTQVGHKQSDALKLFGGFVRKVNSQNVAIDCGISPFVPTARQRLSFLSGEPELVALERKVNFEDFTPTE